MNRLDYLEQPSGSGQQSRLPAEFWQTQQPYQKPQNPFENAWKASNFKITQRPVLSPLDDDYLVKQISEPALFIEGVRIFAKQRRTQPSALASVEDNYLFVRLSEPASFIRGIDVFAGPEWAQVPLTIISGSTAVKTQTLPEAWGTFNFKISKPSVLAPVENTYVIENRSEVAQFVEENQLAGLLKHARDPINRAFGESAVKTLTVVEDDEGFRTLFCLVMVPGDMQEARNALKDFDEEWWLQHSPKVGGKLNFDFELI